MPEVASRRLKLYQLPGMDYRKIIDLEEPVTWVDINGEEKDHGVFIVGQLNLGQGLHKVVPAASLGHQEQVYCCGHKVHRAALADIPLP